MSKEMFDDTEKQYKCVLRFQDLGTGRDRKRILVGNSEDARTSSFTFVGDVCRNWPSWNSVGIKTGKTIETFYTATQTIHAKPAFIFFWNELTADLWFRQVERERLLEWFQTAATVEPGDFVAMAELIVELTEVDYRIWTYPGTVIVNLPRIQVELRKLSLPALRKLSGLIGLESSTDGAMAAMAP